MTRTVLDDRNTNTWKQIMALLRVDHLLQLLILQVSARCKGGSDLLNSAIQREKTFCFELFIFYFDLILFFQFSKTHHLDRSFCTKGGMHDWRTLYFNTPMRNISFVCAQPASEWMKTLTASLLSGSQGVS
jgi:hypothetical protein